MLRTTMTSYDTFLCHKELFKQVTSSRTLPNEKRVASKFALTRLTATITIPSWTFGTT